MVRRQMRILFILPCAWDPRLGQARASIGLAEELKCRGWDCAHEDVSSQISRGRLIQTLFGRFMQYRRTRALLRVHGTAYDVIQVEHDLLRYCRSDYNYNGVLIAKSVGLAHFYERFSKCTELSIRRKRSDLGTLPGRAARRLERMVAGGLSVIENGFKVADRIHANNSDEFEFLLANFGAGPKSALVHSGLSEVEMLSLSRANSPGRVASREIVFAGTWSYRKGRHEFPKILRILRSKDARITLKMLGTGADEASVKREFHAEDREHITIVPTFSRHELPILLSTAKVCVFPTYIEGFGFAVLEALAAGIPVVSWNVPGPREMLLTSRLRELLAPAGDVDETAALAWRVMSLDGDQYHALSATCLQVSGSFSWKVAADQFLMSVHGRNLA